MFFQKLNYHWQKSGQFVLQSVAHILTWHPTGTWDQRLLLVSETSRSPHLSSLTLFTGTCLLTGSASLQLWCNVRSSADLKDEAAAGDPQHSWRCIWQCKSVFILHVTLSFSEYTSDCCSKLSLDVTGPPLRLTSSSFPRMESFLRLQDRFVLVLVWCVHLGVCDNDKKWYISIFWDFVNNDY